jgi:tricorn protease
MSHRRFLIQYLFSAARPGRPPDIDIIPGGTMPRNIAVAIILALCSLCIPAAGDGRFMTEPDIHGQTLVFCYEGDLWTAAIDGGPAVRLTSHPGDESRPYFSPDGRWIAFTGQYDRGEHIYLIPAAGGVPRRLTWRSGAEAVGWTPDGKHVLFRASWEANYRSVTRLYRVAVDGSMPEALPVPRGVLCSFSPDGRRLLYNRRGREEYYWKRYKGGQYQDIWLADPGSGQFTPLTDYVGKNAYPMWLGDSMFFLSDRDETGITNLYRYDFATKETTQITRYRDFDIHTPGCDDRFIVYVQAGWLHVLDTASFKPRKVSVDIPTDQWRLKPRTINPRDYIQSMAPASDGQLAVFEARGDIFLVSGDKDEEPRNLTATPGSRERLPQLAPDGSRVAFISDRDGEYQIYTCPLQGDNPEWIRLTTSLATTLYRLEWSPDGGKILFGTKDLAIYVLDVATRGLTEVARSSQLKNDQFTWETADYTWAPDSRWITYSLVEYNRNNRVYLYDTAERKQYAVTDGFYDCLHPCFDRDHLYFLSYSNFDVRLDMLEDNHVIVNPVQIMALQLRAGEAPPFTGRKESKRPEKSAEKTGGEADGSDEAEPEFRVDVAGLADRLFPVPVPPGNYFRLTAGGGKLVWASSDGFAEDELEQVFTASPTSRWTMHLYDVAGQKEARLEQTVTDWRLSVDGRQILVRNGAAYHLGSVDALFSARSLKDPLALDRLVYTVHPREEWTQIFNDTWRWYRDFFYDPDMHGRDWKAMGDKFRTWIPYLQSRDQLNWLLSQMVGELCVSHTYVFGGDREPRPEVEQRAYTGLLGADLTPDPAGYYRFATIYGPTDYNRDLEAPLVKPDFPLKEGDYLIAINGEPVRVPDNPYRHLQVTPHQKVTLTVNSRPVAEGAVSYDVEPVTSERRLRYERWVAENVRQVLAATDGQVGYMHLTGMSDRNIGQFDKFWRAFRYKKGLIIDVRGNSGGWTEYFMIDKLERQRIGYNCLRYLEPFPYPQGASTARYVVVSNEANGSNGELFIEHFKARGLGTVVGEPSWGGLVGIINLERTIDNGAVFQSNDAFYGAEGKWFVENHGADPDILVTNDPASVMAGRDNQLQKAIEVVLEQIAERPVEFPPRPAYPKK